MSASPPGDQPLKLSDNLVATLVADQFPDLADRDVGRHHALEDHVAVRLGDDYGAIFPTLPGNDGRFALIADLLKPLMPTWTFPISAPIRTGKPGHGYPYHWVIVPWITASTAAFVPLRNDSAAPIGDALRQIHQAAPDDAAPSIFASAPLSDREGEWTAVLAQAAKVEAPEQRVLDIEATQALWDKAIAAGPSKRRTWTHGNLEPRAVLSDRGTFAGLLLWHYFGAGAPEADLGTATLLVPTDARAALLDAYGGVDSESLARIEGFELLAALRFVTHNDPFRARLAWERLIELGLVSAPAR